MVMGAEMSNGATEGVFFFGTLLPYNLSRETSSVCIYIYIYLNIHIYIHYVHPSCLSEHSLGIVSEFGPPKFDALSLTPFVPTAIPCKISWLCFSMVFEDQSRSSSWSNPSLPAPVVVVESRKRVVDGLKYSLMLSIGPVLPRSKDFSMKHNSFWGLIIKHGKVTVRNWSRCANNCDFSINLGVSRTENGKLTVWKSGLSNRSGIPLV